MPNPDEMFPLDKLYSQSFAFVKAPDDLVDDFTTEKRPCRDKVTEIHEWMIRSSTPAAEACLFNVKMEPPNPPIETGYLVSSHWRVDGPDLFRCLFSLGSQGPMIQWDGGLSTPPGYMLVTLCQAWFDLTQKHIPKHSAACSVQHQGERRHLFTLRWFYEE